MIYNPPDKLFGIKIYEELINEFLDITSYVIGDFRLLHTIFEHKNIMILRLEYLRNKKHISPENSIILIQSFQELREMAMQARNLQMKYRINNNASILEKIVSILNSMKTLEIQAITDLIEAIR